jgi:DNA-directed RNA polymerase subunit RPC12/RpoP
MVSIEKSAKCPNCSSSNTYRSRRHGAKEFFLHYLFFTSPYRCQDCDQRFLCLRHIHHPTEKPSEQHPRPA